MYVCVCNAYSEKQILKAVVEGGAKSVKDAYAMLGCQPQCGQCCRFARYLIKSAKRLRDATQCAPQALTAEA